jgi:urea transport system permease protein
MPESWIFMLGALFVLVTLYLPQGLAGLVQQFKAKGWLQRRAAA